MFTPSGTHAGKADPSIVRPRFVSIPEGLVVLQTVHHVLDVRPSSSAKAGAGCCREALGVTRRRREGPLPLALIATSGRHLCWCVRVCGAWQPLSRDRLGRFKGDRE